MKSINEYIMQASDVHSVNEFLSTKVKIDDIENTSKDLYGAPPMTYRRAEIRVNPNWREVAAKMSDWNAGKRKENLKLCSDAKLMIYNKYCEDNNYDVCSAKCEEEANRRGWTFTKLKYN